MKKSFLTLAFLMTVCVLVKAQSGQVGPNNADNSASVSTSKVEFTPRVRAQQGTILLQNRLQLDDMQKARVYTILLDQAKKIDSVRFAKADNKKFQEANYRTCSNSVKAKFRPIIDDSFVKINAVLSNEQRRALTRYQKDTFYLTCTLFTTP